MASVVEHATGTGTAAITTVPLSGDTVVVMLAKNNTWSNASVSGLGGTWTKIYEVVSAASSTDTGLQIWVCTNATTAGTVTPATAPASTHLFLVRGVSATRRIRMYNLGDTNMRDSPAMLVSPGQVVIDLSITYSSAGTWPTTDVVPATGWTFGPNTTKNLFFSYGHAFRVPTTEAVHRITPTSSGGGSRQTMLVLGDPDTPRAVDVIEEIQMIWNGTNTMTGELLATPQAGDVLVATYAGWGSPFVSISGLGATWTTKFLGTTSAPNQHAVAVGTGATSAGTVTVNLTGQTAQVVNVWLVRGLDNTTTTSSIAAVTPNGTTPVSGPSILAGGAKQFVVDFYNYGNPGGAPPTFPVNPAPTDRWQPAQGYRHQSFGYFRNAFRVPVEGSPTTHQTQWATNAGTTSGTVYITQAVVGGAPTPTTTGQAGLGIGATAVAATSVSTTGQAALGIGASATVDNSVVTTGTLPISAELTSVAHDVTVGVTEGQLPLTITASSVASLGDAMGFALFTAAASSAAYGATDATVATQIGLTSAEVLAARQGLPLSGEGTLTSKLTLRVALDLSGQGSLSSSTAFQALMDSALGGIGTLSCQTASVVPMAVELTAFGTLRSHPQGTTRDNIDVWFAGPVVESRETTGPAAGVGTGQGPYLENEYNFSGPED